MQSETPLAPSCGNRSTNPGLFRLVPTFVYRTILTRIFSNHIPWAVISACIVTCTLLILLLRFMLAAENKRRDAEKTEASYYDAVYIAQELPDGSKLEKKVDQAFLDLTDMQNQDFRYAL